MVRPSFNSWIENVIENIRSKNLVTEEQKLVQTKNQIDASRGHYRLLISTDPEVKNITNWETFIKVLRDYTPMNIGESPFKDYSALLNFKWTRRHNLETVSAHLRKIFCDIMEGIQEKYATGIDRDEYKLSNKLMDLFTQLQIYALLPNYPDSLSTDYIKYYNPNLEF